MEEIRNIVKKNREEEVLREIDSTVRELEKQGFLVEFGKIGKKTTYCLIYNEVNDVEYLGYTFIVNMKYYNENVGKLKALHQAIARKETIDQ